MSEQMASTEEIPMEVSMDREEVKESTPSDSLLSHSTLYIRNLSEKVQRNNVRKVLKQLFKQYGPIHKVSVCRKFTLAGQAWITFKKDEDAQKALKAKQGFNLYGFPMSISMANKPSIKQALKLQLPVPPREERIAKIAAYKQSIQNKRQERKSMKAAMDAVAAATAAAAAGVPLALPMFTGSVLPPPNLVGGVPLPLPGPTSTASVPLPAATTTSTSTGNKEAALVNAGIPHNILIAKNLTSSMDADAVRALLDGVTDLEGIRIVGDRGIAFLDFKNEAASTTALLCYQGKEISPGVHLELSFARK